MVQFSTIAALDRFLRFLFLALLSARMGALILVWRPQAAPNRPRVSRGAERACARRVGLVLRRPLGRAIAERSESSEPTPTGLAV